MLYVAFAEISIFAMAFVETAEYKIILLGEPGVGKTNYFFRLRDGTFAGSSVSTISQGVEHMTFKTTVDGDEVKANIFDTAGGERFRTLTSNYFQHTDAAVLMYAVDDQRSLERLYDEVENALKFVESDSFIWALVGNKADLRPEIEEASAKALSNQIGAKIYYYTSAKTGLNVTESMTALVQTLHRQYASGGRLQSQSYRGHHQIVTLPTSSDRGTAAAGGRTPNITSANSMKTKCCN